MSATAITATVGTKTSNTGRTVVKVNPSQTNDLTHVATYPEAGRIVMRDAAGFEYTSLPGFTVSTSAGVVTFVREAQ